MGWCLEVLCFPVCISNVREALKPDLCQLKAPKKAFRENIVVGFENQKENWLSVWAGYAFQRKTSKTSQDREDIPCLAAAIFQILSAENGCGMRLSAAGGVWAARAWFPAMAQLWASAVLQCLFFQMASCLSNTSPLHFIRHLKSMQDCFWFLGFEKYWKLLLGKLREKAHFSHTTSIFCTDFPQSSTFLSSLLMPQSSSSNLPLQSWASQHNLPHLPLFRHLAHTSPSYWGHLWSPLALLQVLFFPGLPPVSTVHW